MYVLWLPGQKHSPHIGCSMLFVYILGVCVCVCVCVLAQWCFLFICHPCVVPLRAMQSTTHRVVLANIKHTHTHQLHTHIDTHTTQNNTQRHTHSLDTDPDRTRPGYTLITCLELDIISASRLTLETEMEGQVRDLCLCVWFLHELVFTNGC